MGPPEQLVARVAIAVPLPQLFDYSCENLSREDVGRCVRVPFGASEKNGVIVDVLPSSVIDSSRLKAVSRVLRELPPLPLDWLALVGFVSRYYHEPLGEVIALALPPGLRRSDAVDSAAADPFVAASVAGRTALEAGRESRARQLVAALSETGAQRRSVVREHPLAAALADAMRRGWIEIVDADRPPHTIGSAPVPTPDQQTAIDAVKATGKPCCSM